MQGRGQATGNQSDVVVCVSRRVTFAIGESFYGVHRIISIRDWFSAAAEREPFSFKAVAARDLAHLSIGFVVRSESR